MRMTDMGMPKSILVILILPILLAFGLTLLAPKAADEENAVQAPPAAVAEQTAAEISPWEDLMREHGLLQRILLVYGEIAKRLENGKEFPPETLAAAADMVRTFIEEYHVRLEEEYIFPFFEKAGRKTDLVKALRDQHAAGRRMTDEIKAQANPAAFKNIDHRNKLAAALSAFIRMYRPHAAREDTVLFPAAHTLVTAEERAALGARFQDRETAVFGVNGFEKHVARIAELEKTIGIGDLAQYIPPAEKKKPAKQ